MSMYNESQERYQRDWQTKQDLNRPTAPPASEPLYRVFNETDGVYASPDHFTKAEAERFIGRFKGRFATQGFYSSVDGRIPISSLSLILQPIATVNPASPEGVARLAETIARAKREILADV